MKRTVLVAVTASVLMVSTMALAFPPGGRMMGPGATGPGGMGPWMMGGGAGWGPGGGWCGGATGAGAVEAVTEEKARVLATEYAQTYFKGYSVERVLPFTGRFRTMYQVELKGPKGEVRVLHVTPWGGVRPWGPLAATE